MMAKPRSYNLVGIVQMLLAAAFTIWLAGFPALAGHFAWPVVPELTAMFLGCSFLLRALLGFQMWREREWHRLRWLVRGNYVFLAVIFLATFWHLGQMNWRPDILVAHLWVVAYVVEPLMLVLFEPHNPESRAAVPAEAAQGPIARGLKAVLLGIYLFGFTIGAMLLINPQFADTRWPWPLDPFDARIMAAWPMACAVWCGTMYSAQDWSEIRMGVRSIMAYAAALFVFWFVTYPHYDPARKNGLTFGVASGLAAATLLFYYWRHELARRRMPVPALPTPSQAGE